MENNFPYSHPNWRNLCSQEVGQTVQIDEQGNESYNRLGQDKIEDIEIKVYDKIFSPKKPII